MLMFVQVQGVEMHWLLSFESVDLRFERLDRVLSCWSACFIIHHKWSIPFSTAQLTLFWFFGTTTRFNVLQHTEPFRVSSAWKIVLSSSACLIVLHALFFGIVSRFAAGSQENSGNDGSDEKDGGQTSWHVNAQCQQNDRWWVTAFKHWTALVCVQHPSRTCPDKVSHRRWSWSGLARMRPFWHNRRKSSA